MSFDAVVVGAGAVGTALAWRLSERGLQVLLCDGRTPGQEATWAAAGMLCAQIEAVEPGPLLDLLLAGEERWSALSDRLEVQRTGVLEVAFTEAELAALERQRIWQRARGLSVEQVTADQLRHVEPGLNPELAGANFFPRGGQVDSRTVPAVLRAEAERLGAICRPGRVNAVEVSGGRVRAVHLEGARLETGLVIVAAGAWSSQIAGLGLAANAVVPVRGQLLAFSVVPPPVSRAVFGSGGYVLPRQGNRCLAGTTMERVGFDAAVTEEARALLAQRARRLCPALEALEIAEAWAGLRPATVDGLPAFGPTPIEGLHLAVGLFRNGILLAPLVADLTVNAIFGNRNAIPEAFAASRLFA